MSRPTSISARAPRARRSGEAGFTIIEVLVAALIVAIVSAGGAVAFGAAIGTSGNQRHRSAAEALAQRNQARLTGYTVGQLANLNQTLSPVTIDGTQYTVQETATFVSDSSGASASCTNPSADYLETSSSVTWTGMPSALAPVTVTGVITPTLGEISSSAGVLAVQVTDPSGTKPIAGLPVSVSGPSSASGTTAANGCVLFGDLPVGSYTVSVTPASGAYVDAVSGQAVNASSPDTATNVTVTSGTTAASPSSFALAVPGAATFSFTSAWPTGVAPSPAPVATSPSVILANGSLKSPSYIVCSNQDTSGCPTVGHPDTNWGASAWSSANGGTLTAQPLAPYTYATYAGICTSDDPSLSTYGGVDASTVVASGPTPAMTSLTLPAIVVRLYSGTGIAGVIPVQPAARTEMALPSGSKLVITDTGCAEHYVGGPGVSAVPSGDSSLPYNSAPVTNGGLNDIGLLSYPGMPDGSYTVCYQNGSQYAQVSVTNKGSGEVVNLYNLSLTTGSCAT